MHTVHDIDVTTEAASQKSAIHQWVGAAVVGLGQGDTARAEHAARTGRHVLHGATRIEVLEVYCHRCRVAYGPRAERMPCVVPFVRAV